MKNFFLKIKTFIVAHKIISAIIIIAILGLGYYGYGKITNTGATTRYVLSKVTKGTIISSVTDSGQVSAFNQININPTVSGALTSVNVSPGDKVTAGQTLFIIDNTTVQKAVRDAEINLQNANLALQKLELQNSDINLSTASTKAYNDGFNAVTSTFYDLNSTLTGINNILAKGNLSDSAVRASGDTALNYEQSATLAYYKAETAFQKNNSDYVKLNNASPNADIENIIGETYDTTKLLATAIKSTENLVDYMAQDSSNSSSFTSYQTTLSAYINTINTDSANLLSAETNISSAKEAFPSNDLSTQSAEISIKQAQNSLSDAQQNLSYYYIKAPFDGIIASVPVIKGANASSGTTLATIITSKDLATVTLSEIDVAKITLGDQATLTFNAIPNLTIAGQVAEIDSVGTVSQGVVNYNVQISFDATNDGGIKPGMSVNAAIITNVKQNVLMVPNAAIKTQGGVSYVQTFSAPLPAPVAGVQGSPSATPPKSQIVTTGISNDTFTEIVSGLNEGDEIVTKTIASTTASTTTTAPSILGAATGRGGGGGGARIP